MIEPSLMSELEQLEQNNYNNKALQTVLGLTTAQSLVGVGRVLSPIFLLYQHHSSILKIISKNSNKKNLIKMLLKRISLLPETGIKISELSKKLLTILM